MSLIGFAVCAAACGSLLAAGDDDDNDAPVAVDAGVDGAAGDETTVGFDDDASTVDLTADASAFDGGVCPPTAPWTVKGSFAMPETDIRSVRRVADTYYFAYVEGSSAGIDLAAAPAKANGTGGATLGWFASINGPSGQTIPAVGPDELTLVYQSNVSSTAAVLMMSKRSTPTQPWPAPSSVTYNQTVDTANEPYITQSGVLWFTEANGLVKEATMQGAPQLDIVKTYPELTPARFPVVSNDGLEIIFTRSDTKEQNLYSATRTSTTAPFGTPAPVTSVNAADHNTRVAWISKDSCTLFFVRNDSLRADDPFKFFIALR